MTTPKKTFIEELLQYIANNRQSDLLTVDDGKEDLFKEDLFKEHGVEENPKRDLCHIAWERGHAYGLHNVASVFEDIVRLIK